jgi:7-cyano-7-deazaguanine synthase in queuosine biosynthesis
MNFLISWSGGIDSTYRLAEVLENTDYEVFADHFSNLTSENDRHRHEYLAVMNLYERLQTRYRKFQLTFGSIDHGYVLNPNPPAEGKVLHEKVTLPFDMATVCFRVGVLAKHWEHKGKKISKFSIGSHSRELHWSVRWDSIYQAAKAAAWPRDAPEFDLRTLVSKAAEIKFLEERQLYDLTWFCRTPVNGSECGQCQTCVEVGQALKELEGKDNGTTS